MAILINTINPGILISKIRDAIDDGAIDTWIYDEDGDFTHTPPQWLSCSWMRPYPIDSRDGYNFAFVIVPSKKYHFTKSLYGVYHGRFAEMLLTHFDDDILKLEITPMLDPELDFWPTA